MSEFFCLLIPIVTVWIVYFIVDASTANYSQFVPISALMVFFFAIGLAFYEADKNDLFEKPHEYECPVGKVVFYNFGNVICIDGEKARILK